MESTFRFCVRGQFFFSFFFSLGGGVRCRERYIQQRPSCEKPSRNIYFSVCTPATGACVDVPESSFPRSVFAHFVPKKGIPFTG